VNNDAAPHGEVPPAENREKLPNKLLEVRNDERLEHGTQGATSGTDSQLEAVAAIKGPKSPEGKARVARNAYKGESRTLIHTLAKLLRQQEQQRRKLA
jgi:hypothetical protein